MNEETTFMDHSANDQGQRIVALETSVKGLHSEMGEIKSTLGELVSVVGKGQQTNWSNVFAGATVLLAVVAGLWGACINPLNRDIERQGHSADTLASAVIAQDLKIQAIKDEVVALKSFQDFTREALQEMKVSGSPGADKRLTILEYRLDHP